MDKLFEQLSKLAKQIILTKDEKSQEREKLLNFMSNHPIRNIVLARQQWAWSNFFNGRLLIQRPAAAFITIILAVFAVGGISSASQSSLPGDVLYPVKLKTEEVRSVLAFSTEAKAKLEAELAQTRLTEAEALSTESKLDTNTRTELENSFEKHANRVQAHTAKLATVDARAAADINSNLEISLKAHDRILSNLAKAKDGKTKPEISNLLIKVRSETEDAGRNKNDEEENIKIQPRVNIQSPENIKVDVRFNSERNNEVEDTDGAARKSRGIDGSENSESD